MNLRVRRIEFDEDSRSLLEENDLPMDDISPGDTLFFEAVAESERIGMGALQVSTDLALLRSVVIEKSRRGNGYGTTLVNGLVEQARRIRVNELYLLTTSAESFFEQLGFQSVSRDEAPSGIRSTAQFQHLCPDTAATMKMEI